MDQRSLPLGYSFLGNEPDLTVCCDLRDCQRQQAVDYKRLNCGHSFHTECLRDTCSDLGQSASNADRARLCPICHLLLEDRIRELSTTMNRLVKKKRFWKTSKLSTNCQKARFLLSEATNSFFFFFLLNFFIELKTSLTMLVNNKH